MPYQVREFPIVAQTRNCPKCGGEYKVYDPAQYRPRLCPACKKPHPPPRPPRLNRQALLGQPFSIRQKQILGLILEGKLNKEIAHDLHLAEGTVKVFMGDIFSKAGVSNRTQLAVWWLRNGGA